MGLFSNIFSGSEKKGVQLIDAIYCGDIQKVDFLIKKGADTNTKDPDGETALHTALIFGNFQIAKLLIEKGADPNAKRKDGCTALLAALTRSHEIAKLLIEKGANLNLKDNNGVTPLSSAIAFDYFEIAQLLIEKGADPNVKDIYGHTALDYALEKGNIKITQLLKEKGANSNIKTEDSGSVLAPADKWNILSGNDAAREAVAQNVMSLSDNFAAALFTPMKLGTSSWATIRGIVTCHGCRGTFPLKKRIMIGGNGLEGSIITCNCGSKINLMECGGSKQGTSFLVVSPFTSMQGQAISKIGLRIDKLTSDE